MSEELIAEIVATCLGLAITVLGVKYKKIKALLKKIIDAAKDDKFTAEEVQDIALDIKGLF